MDLEKKGMWESVGKLNKNMEAKLLWVYRKCIYHIYLLVWKCIS